MSIISWTSPRPSLRILPASRLTSVPSASLWVRRASPYRRTRSPRCGAGTSRQCSKVRSARPIESSRTMRVGVHHGADDAAVDRGLHVTAVAVGQVGVETHLREELGCSDHVFHSPRIRHACRPGPAWCQLFVGWRPWDDPCRDPPLPPARDGGRVQRHRPPRSLAGDRAAGHRSLGGAGGRARRRCPGLPGSGARGRRGLRGGLRRARARHRSRRRRLRRRHPRRHRLRRRARGGQVDPLRADLVRRRRHRLVLDAARRLRSPAGRGRRAGGDTEGHRAAAPPHHDDRPHPRHPRRAHDLRREGGAVVPPGRPRPRPVAGRAHRHRRGQALGRRRHVLQHRSRRGAVGLRGARALAGPRHPGRSPGTATPSSCGPVRRSGRRSS